MAWGLGKQGAWGLALGAQGGVWLINDVLRSGSIRAADLDPMPFFSCIRSMVPFNPHERAIWMIDVEVAQEFALWHEEAAVPRPAAMPLQEREHMVALLAQRGLRVRELQLHILEFAELAQAPLPPDASRAR